jgi:CheY-like chemotaxis protein
VDDEPDVSRVVERVLAEAGYEVRSAADATEALALLEGPCPDLLIVDHRLPDRTGDEVIRRARSRYPDLPILRITGGPVEPGFHPGVPTLLKPFSADALLAEVRKYTAA